MDLKVHYYCWPLPKVSKQTLKIMKLIAVILFAACIQVSAKGYSQITLSETNTPLQKVFQKIQEQSGYDFVATYETILQAGNVTVNVQNVSLAKALEACLKGKLLTYVIIGKTVVVRADAKTDYKLTSIIGEMALPPPPVEIHGRVVNQQGEPLQNVSVLVEGTKMGTTTNTDGYFTLTAPDNKNLMLEISSVGYQTKKVTVGNKTEINVTLELDISGLSDVVVVGYGTQKKVDVTGSIVSISDKQLKTSTNVSLSDALAGKLPGLSVVQQTGQPGDYSSQISIRGWGSPLVIVDGVQRSDFAKIDPNEIASISVLKDASAAIYGVKASNGVILITTKKGKEGKPQISYSYTHGWQKVTSFPRPMTAAEYTQAFDWAEQNSGIPLTYSAQEIADYKSGKLPSTNWWNVAMNNSAPQNQHNLTVSGGSKNIKYFNSIGFMNQDGLYKSGDLNYNRINIRSDVTAQITKNFDAEMNISGLSDNNNAPSVSPWVAFKGIWMQVPTYSVYANNNPLYLQNMPDGNNPYAVTHSSIVGYNDSYNKTFDGSFALNYKIPFVDGLKARFFYDYYLNDNFNKTFNKSYTLYDYDNASKIYSPSSVNSPSNLSEGYGQNTNSTMDLSLNYDKTFRTVHHFQGLLLFEKLDFNSNNLSGNRHFTVDALDQLSAGNTVMQITGGNDVNKSERQSVVGRLNYDYASKYLFEFNFREDGSSVFPPNKQWGFFPGVLVGWRLSNENFIRNNLHFISSLKLRGSWGQMGDDAAAAYQYITGYNYPSGGYVINGNYTSGISSRGMANSNITWYTSTTSNIGLDGSLWGQNLNFTIDAFMRKRTGLLASLALSLPQTVGASLPQMNVNSDLSRGFEVSIGTTQHIKDFQFSVNTQFSYAQLEWQHHEQALAGNSYLNWLNSLNDRSANIIWGYKVAGHFTSQGQINTAAIEDGNGNKYVKIGDLNYVDVNHDGVINSLDMVPIAKGNAGTQQGPEITYGVNFSFSWKGFEVNALFQGAGNFNVNIQNTDQLANPFPWGRNGLSQFTDVWHQADPTDENSAWVPGTFVPSRISGINPNNLTSTYFVKDASYLRLKSLEIGYTISDQLIKKIGFQELRIFANGFNLFTWSGIPYMDPEHPQSTYGYLYPITKNYNLGLNLTF